MQAMDAIVEVLVEKETVSGDEFRKILGQYAKIPESNYSKWDRETVCFVPCARVVLFLAHACHLLHHPAWLRSEQSKSLSANICQRRAALLASI